MKTYTKPELLKITLPFFKKVNALGVEDRFSQEDKKKMMGDILDIFDRWELLPEERVAFLSVIALTTCMSDSEINYLKVVVDELDAKKEAINSNPNIN